MFSVLNAFQRISSFDQKPAKNGKGRGGDGEARDLVGARGERHDALEAAHVAHVLRRVGVVLDGVHAVDDRAGAEEEAGLEEGVRHQVEDAGPIRADADADEHEAELAHRAVGEDLLDVVLEEADGRREERRGGADEGDDGASPSGSARRGRHAARSCRRRR